MEVKEHSKYWSRIKMNIKKLKEDGKITKRYKYDSFCNNFIPDLEPLKTSITNKCMCDHDIVHNFKYTHKDRDDTFIMGSCCIKKFSTVYKEFRECKICNNKIKKNKDNLCKECRDKEKERLLYIEKCKCEGCGYIKKDDKYKNCYNCNMKNKLNKIKCGKCGKDMKDDKYKNCYDCNKKNKREFILEKRYNKFLDEQNEDSENEYDPIADNIRVALDSWD